jgi:hypothetical protein
MKRTSPLSKLCKLTLLLVLTLAPVIASATAANPCPASACKYTYQNGCCISDPRFDCFDFCF